MFLRTNTFSTIYLFRSGLIYSSMDDMTDFSFCFATSKQMDSFHWCYPFGSDNILSKHWKTGT
jgi:hypothetical protein